MIELLLCSIFTLLPDYLYRRYGQGKRLGVEITFYSFWYEFRYGITACLMLTVALITVVFYHHPSTSNVTSYFRTVPIIPETNGRVAEIYVGFSGEVEKGSPIFRLDNTKQQAALETAKRRVEELDAQLIMARADVVAAGGQIRQAKGSLQQAIDELETKQELQRRNPGFVARRVIERLGHEVDARQGTLTATNATLQAAETRLQIVLPAEKASAQAATAQAQVDLDKTVIYAGVSGRVEQFVLRVGDIVNPLMRPAGNLSPLRRRAVGSRCRIRSDRASSNEDRHGGRSHMRVEALDDHTHGCHASAGLCRCRPAPHLGPTRRCATSHPARDTNGLLGTAVRRRARWRYSRQ